MRGEIDKVTSLFQASIQLELGCAKTKDACLAGD